MDGAPPVGGRVRRGWVGHRPPVSTLDFGIEPYVRLVDSFARLGLNSVRAEREWRKLDQRIEIELGWD
jgi:hypothetical protein